jgi:hypothetical protein
VHCTALVSGVIGTDSGDATVAQHAMERARASTGRWHGLPLALIHQ